MPGGLWPLGRHGSQVLSADGEGSVCVDGPLRVFRGEQRAASRHTCVRGDVLASSLWGQEVTDVT